MAEPTGKTWGVVKNQFKSPEMVKYWHQFEADLEFNSLESISVYLSYFVRSSSDCSFDISSSEGLDLFNSNLDGK